MIPEVLVAVISLLTSSLLGGVVATDFFRKIIYKLLKKELPQKTYSERLSELTSNLTKASSEVDNVLQEMAQVATDREKAVKELENGLIDLEKREKELEEKISLLQNLPIPVAEHFAKLVEPGEKRSARRDYVLFMAGVIVTTIIAIVLQVGLTQ
jgi:ElaB/YqjD/DUF883 family membrane-anchored ribosome-binding protein